MRSADSRKADSPNELSAFLYDIEKGEGKCWCVYQVSCLMMPSYRFPHRKSTASKNASQFVYKQKNMAIFIHKSFKK